MEGDRGESSGASRGEICLEEEAESLVFTVLSETLEKGELRLFGLLENKILEEVGVVKVFVVGAVSASSSVMTIDFLPFEGELVGVLMVRFGLRDFTGVDGSGTVMEASRAL